MPGLVLAPPYTDPAGHNVHSTAQPYTGTAMSPYASSSSIPPVHLQSQLPSVTAEHFPIEDVVIGDCAMLRDVAISTVPSHYADNSKFAMAPDSSSEQEMISLSENQKHRTVTSKLKPKSINNYQ